MKLNLSAVVTAIDGTPSETKLSEILANELVNQPFGDAYKFYGWAEKLAKCGEIDLMTPNDVDCLKDWIFKNPRLTILVKVQAVRAIDAQMNLICGPIDLPSVT